MTEPAPTTKRTPARKAAAKPKAKAKTPAKRNAPRKPPPRPRWEPATPADFDKVDDALNRAARRAEKDKPLTAEERVTRDSALVAAVIGRGLRLETMAARLGLSGRQARRIVDNYRESRASRAFPDSMTILFDCLDAIEAQIEEASIFSADKKANDGARIAAMRLRREMETDKLQLLMHMGVVRPDVHAQVRQAEFMRRFGAGLKALREAGVSEPQIAAMRDAMESGQGAEVITLDDVRHA